LLLSMKLFEAPKLYSGSLNFGPQYDSFKSVRNLVDKIIECWGSGSIEYQINPDAPHESGLLHLNCDKSNQQLNWIPNWNFISTVEETIGWYKKYSEGVKIFDLTKGQINKYMESIND
jgi:CDP-glucose 4,6-dehydratase